VDDDRDREPDRERKDLGPLDAVEDDHRDVEALRRSMRFEISASDAPGNLNL
jgi:hypothetical protein